MSSKYWVYNSLIARRAGVLFAVIMSILIGSLAIIQHNRATRGEEVVGAAGYLYEVRLIAPTNQQVVEIQEGVGFLVIVVGEPGMITLPSASQVEFYSHKDFLGTAKEITSKESEDCGQNQRCVVGSYAFDWGEGSDIFPLRVGEYSDVYVTVKQGDGRTVGFSESVSLRVD